MICHKGSKFAFFRATFNSFAMKTDLQLEPEKNEWYPGAPEMRGRGFSFLSSGSILTVLTVFSLLGSFFPAKSQTVHPDFTDGWVYAKIKDDSAVELPLNGTDPEFNAIVSDYGIVSITQPFSGINTVLDKTYRIIFTQQVLIDSLIYDLQNLPYIEYAEKSPLYKTMHIPNDLQPSQWSLLKINATSAWDYSTGSTSVTVAIVDNAINIAHEDLTANVWTNPNETDGNIFDDDLNGYTNDMHGWDVADNDNNPNPPSGITASSFFNHGTHCAGIASASTNNSKGVASIGYNVKIIAVKCSKNNAADDGASLPYAYDGVVYAIKAGADVISMSWGGNSGSFITGSNIIAAAHNLDIVLVAASGNDNTASPFYPAAYDYVIGVGATNQSDTKAGFSNYGTAVDVMAPGVSIFSTIGNSVNAYGFLSGTSMACPMVAGLSALIISHQTGIVPEDVEMFIKAGCDNIDNLNPTYAGQLGSGRINAGKTFSIITSSDWYETDQPFFIFPNPNNGRFTLIYNFTDPEFNLSIFDLQGKLVYSKETIYNERSQEMDFSNLSTGMYLVQISNDTSSWAEKLVISEKFP